MIPQDIKPIPGYESYYGVTIDGRVFSFQYNRSNKTKELAQTIRTDKRREEKSRYRRVKVWHIKNNSPVDVHRLVALAWIPNPENKPQINHLDGNKKNNHASNLEWCTVGENVRHAEANGLSTHVVGEEHGMHKLLESEVIQIRKELSEIKSYKGQLIDIGEKYGVSNYCIWDIKHGKSWRYLL